jgi:hypothetical protein
MVKWFLDHETRKRRLDFMMQSNQTVLKQRLQAFERFTLYLERISPESLVLREQSKKMNVLQFQNHLLRTIRTEFNHNMAMQIYIPKETWDLIKTAREQVVRLVNTTATQVPPNVPSFELGRRIIEDAGESTTRAVSKAIGQISKNVQEIGIT